MKMPHHIISADQFNPELLEEIFEEAERIREIITDGIIPKPIFILSVNKR